MYRQSCTVRSIQITSNSVCTCNSRNLVAIDFFCSLIITLSIREIQLWKAIAHLPTEFTPMFSPYIELDAICQNWWCETTKKMFISFAQLYLLNGKVKINEEDKVIATWSLYLPNFLRSDLNTSTWGIVPCGICTVLVQDTKIYFHIENSKLIALTYGWYSDLNSMLHVHVYTWFQKGQISLGTFHVLISYVLLRSGRCKN